MVKRVCAVAFSLIALSACGKSDNSTPIALGGTGYNGYNGYCTGANCYNNGGYNNNNTGGGWYGNANGNLPPLLSPSDPTGYRAFYPAIYVQAGQRVSVFSNFKYGPPKPALNNLLNGCSDNDSGAGGYVGNGIETFRVSNASSVVAFTTAGWIRYGVDFYRNSICSTSLSAPRISVLP